MIIMMVNMKWCDAGAGAGELFKILEQIVATFWSKVVKY